MAKRLGRLKIGDSEAVGLLAMVLLAFVMLARAFTDKRTVLIAGLFLINEPNLAAAVTWLAQQLSS